MLPGLWYFAASPAASLLVGAALILFLARRGFHRNADGSLGRRRLASVVVLGASTYTFGVLTLSQLVLHGPSLSSLCKDGFGDTRIAYLLFGVMLDGVFRIWDEFRHIGAAA